MQQDNFQSKNVKVLQFSFPISETLQATGDKPQDALKTGVYFKNKKNDKNKIDIKTHITNPAMVRIRDYLLNKFGATKSKQIMKEVFVLLDSLTKNNTALLSVYIPKNYLKQDVYDNTNN